MNKEDPEFLMLVWIVLGLALLAIQTGHMPAYKIRRLPPKGYEAPTENRASKL